MELSLFRLAFYGIPESIGIIAVTFAIAKVELGWKTTVFFGVLLGCTAYVLRLIPITFGVHTIVCIGLVIFLLNYYSKVDLIRTITSVLVTFIILAIIETISRMATLKILNWSLEDVMKNELLITITGMPEIIILFVIAFSIKKYIFKGCKKE